MLWIFSKTLFAVRMVAESALKAVEKGAAGIGARGVVCAG